MEAANESPNLPANWKKRFNRRFVGPFYRTVAKDLFLRGVESFGHLLKPLKTEENIRKYLNKNRTIKNNLRLAYPNIVSMKRSRAIQDEENYRFLQNITENKVSNLAIARFIESRKTSLFEKNNNERRDLGYSKLPNSIRNISSIYNGLVVELKKANLLGADETLSNEAINDIFLKYNKIEAWTGLDRPAPRRQRAQLLLTVPEINFILILSDMNASQTGFKTYKDFHTALQAAAESTRIEAIKSKVITFLNKIDETKILENRKGSDMYFVKEIQYERLFIDTTGNPVCQHIADFPTDLTPSMEPRALHHALYFSKDILIEMFAQRLKDEKTGIFISMKTIYDYLKLLRSKNKELYIIPYENSFSNDILRRRALWCLGKYPIYAPYDENCENYPSWVFENNLGLPEMCIPYTKERAQLYENRRPFFSTFMKETYQGQENTVRGGKTRKFRMPKRRQTRRYTNLTA